MSELVGLLKCAPLLPPGPQPLALGMGPSALLPPALELAPLWLYFLGLVCPSFSCPTSFSTVPPAPSTRPPFCCRTFSSTPSGVLRRGGKGEGGRERGGGGSPGQWKVLECDFIPVPPDWAGAEGSPCTIGGVVYSLLLLL